jgi:hypothetical protein
MMAETATQFAKAVELSGESACASMLLDNARDPGLRAFAIMNLSLKEIAPSQRFD